MSIRIAVEADIPAMLGIYGPYVQNTTYSFEYQIPDPAAFTARFRAITAQFPWLVWEENGEILGYAYGSAPFERAAYQWCAEDSIYLAPAARGRGIGRRLHDALEEILRLQGYQLIYAIITSENAASLAFHRAMGYRLLAEFPACGFKFGRVLGVTWMEKRLSSGVFPSEKPTHWMAIVKNDRNLMKILAKLTLS